MHAGGGSFGPERERHVGGSNGYVIIEKVEEKPGFLFPYTGTPQYYTIPKTGIYTFTAVGAKGGGCDGCDKATCDWYPTKEDWCHACNAQYHEGGYGALVRGKLLLRKGDKLEIIVGGKGQDCKALPRDAFVKDKSANRRKYLETRTGAGGGGASSVRIKYDDGREDLLLTAGAGGGSGFFYNGEDGEEGPDGGFDWGGRHGGGGGLGPRPDDPTIAKEIFAFGGAGGGGVYEYGNGASRNARFSTGSVYYGLRVDGDVEVWAEGGFSLFNGGQGGYVDREKFYIEDTSKPKQDFIRALSGSAGGYGGGGQGGSGE